LSQCFGKIGNNDSFYLIKAMRPFSKTKIKADIKSAFIQVFSGTWN